MNNLNEEIWKTMETTRTIGKVVEASIPPEVVQVMEEEGAKLGNLLMVYSEVHQHSPGWVAKKAYVEVYIRLFKKFEEARREQGHPRLEDEVRDEVLARLEAQVEDELRQFGRLLHVESKKGESDG